jgi:hypothetical protein
MGGADKTIAKITSCEPVAAIFLTVRNYEGLIASKKLAGAEHNKQPFSDFVDTSTCRLGI